MTDLVRLAADLASDVRLPRNCVVESGVTVEHGVIFVDHGPRPTILREQVRVEAGAVIGQDVELGRGSIVRAGSVVLSSVPPNAIVQGNPAAIVGYVTALPGDVVPVKAPMPPETSPGPTPLGVGDAALYDLPHFADIRGSLSVAEFETDLPFVPRRYFLVFDVPSQELRGEHAHRECHQFLICVHGSCRALVDDGHQRAEVLLDDPTRGLYMPPMIWGTQYRYTRDAILLVFASHPYDAADYIRDYKTFRREAQVGQ